ncbi:MAG: helix-turn-helix domain containing protein [Bacteroidales bacterium]|nr:helix-turn-helix domain containing protein [Bacteroidales bacterium]
MNEISERFLKLVTYVTTNNIVKNKKELAKLIGVSSSSLTEIFSGRSNVGIKVIQNAVLSFDMINVEWLITGRGEMLKKDVPIYNVSEKKEDCKEIKLENKYLRKEIENLKEQAKLKDQIIELLKDKTRQSIHKKPTHTQK